MWRSCSARGRAQHVVWPRSIPELSTCTAPELLRRDEQCPGVRLRARKSRAGVVYKESLVNIIVFCVLAGPGEGTAGNAVQMWQRSRELLTPAWAHTAKGEGPGAVRGAAP